MPYGNGTLQGEAWGYLLYAWLIKYPYNPLFFATTILDKSLNNILYLGRIFIDILAVAFLPLPLEVVLLCLYKKAWSLGVRRKQRWTGGGEFCWRKAVDLELVLLRKVVRINDNTFLSSSVRDCSSSATAIAVKDFKLRVCDSACDLGS